MPVTRILVTLRSKINLKALHIRHKGANPDYRTCINCVSNIKFKLKPYNT